MDSRHKGRNDERREWVLDCQGSKTGQLAGRSVSEYGGQWTEIDNDKCEDSVPQCGIIAHSGFIDQKWSENKSRWDRTAQNRIELNGMRWMLSELIAWRKGECHVLRVASHICVCFIDHTINITFKTFECHRTKPHQIHPCSFKEAPNRDS